MTSEDIANNVAMEIDAICAKYDVQIGVWLTWRDLQKNIHIMANTPGLDELHFGLQLRIPDAVNNTNKARNKGTTRVRKSR